LDRDKAGSRGTTQVIVVDTDGGIASMNHSIGNNGAALVTPGLGFIYNNFMRFFDPRPGSQRSAEPAKRMGGASSLAFFKDGSPRFVVGGAGGTRIVTAMLQTTLNVFDFSMDPQTAVATPRFHSQAGRSIFIEPRFDDSVASELESMGYMLSRSNYQARIQAIRIREDTDLAVDPRSQSGGRWPPPNMADDPSFVSAPPVT
jgi:gamma-glutamyltranspeptidase/glutathione hydrolase